MDMGSCHCTGHLFASGEGLKKGDLETFWNGHLHSSIEPQNDIRICL